MEYTVYQLLWLFLFYSFLGWLAETVLAALKRRRLLNRGFLSAPFSPTYGLGALLFAIFLPELREDPFFLFLLGMIWSELPVYSWSASFIRNGGTIPASGFSLKDISA